MIAPSLISWDLRAPSDRGSIDRRTKFQQLIANGVVFQLEESESTVLRSPRVLSLILYPVLRDTTMRAAVVKRVVSAVIIAFSAYGYSQ